MRFLGIDPATKTGIVALDIEGNVILERELRGEGPKDPGGISDQQLVDLENQLFRLMLPGDQITLESPAPGTIKAISTGFIHGGIRTMIHRKGLRYDLVNPMWTKKYVDVKVKRGQTQKEKKEEMAAAALKYFGYSHKSDNVVDAYIIARICLNIYLMRNHKPLLDNERIQREVVQDIIEKTF